MFLDRGNQDYLGKFPDLDYLADFPAVVSQQHLGVELLRYQERKSNQPMNQTREERLESAYNYGYSNISPRGREGVRA